MEKAQLVFVPASGMGHLVSALEVAKLLLTVSPALHHCPYPQSFFCQLKSSNYVELQKASSSTISNRLRFIDLPKDETELFNFSSFIERQKPHVKEAGLKITQSESSKIRDEENFNPTEFKGSTAELPVPTLVNPFPARIMPSAMLSKEWLPPILDTQEEQQFNAFEMVIDLGLAVEIRMDYRNDGGVIAYSNEIERGIKCLMEYDNEKRKKVKEMSERSRMALMNG
ncbi:hypothetical protein GH714_004965 [Hevea brasiliensis]|uniref:Anthocyanidin 3-O-glucosyltransferase n=1 Tax=Hevea brasiliensis TaxID=3981 RepID=A0A6A6L295_HEVBR|nr:hypothetical protein GH714_004965 [Hevea brasiliensis]